MPNSMGVRRLGPIQHVSPTSVLVLNPKWVPRLLAPDGLERVSNERAATEPNLEPLVAQPWFSVPVRWERLEKEL